MSYRLEPHNKEEENNNNNSSSSQKKKEANTEIRDEQVVIKMVDEESIEKRENKKEREREKPSNKCYWKPIEKIVHHTGSSTTVKRTYLAPLYPRYTFI